MILSNVDIGSGPGLNDGESLYSAFYKVNQNFANVQSNVNGLSNSVTSVAGRSGNVVLTVNDIIGLSNAYAIASSTATANTAMRGYVDTKIAANIAALINGAPGALDTLEELAAALGNNASFSATIINSLATTNSNLIVANTSMRGYVDGQILAANSGITSAVTSANLGLKGYVDYTNTVQSTEIANANVAMKGYVDQANSIQSAQISLANIGIKGYIDQANSIQSAQISAANIGVIGYIDQANTIQSAQVGAANLAIIAANVGMRGYVDSVASLSIYSNVNTKAYTESMGFSNYSNSNVRSYLTGGFDGNIIPSANVTYSLGTPTRQWKDLYVSNNTIYIGGTPLSSTPGGLTFAGTPVSSFAPTSATTVTPGTVWNYANTVRASSQLVYPAYGSGKFVIVESGTYGGIIWPNIGMYSTDGTTWTTMYLPNIAQQATTIAYGAGKFIVPYSDSSQSGNGAVAYSADGINWTLKSNAIPYVEYTGSPGSNNCTWLKTGAAYGNGRFVLLSSVGARTVISTDGITWSNGSAYGDSTGSFGSRNPLPLVDGQGYSLYYSSLTFDNGWFVASAYRQSGTGANVFAYSSDGINWTRTQLSIGAQPGYTGQYLLGSGAGVFIAIPASGSIGLRSTDNGRTWSNINIPSAYTYTSVTYGGGVFILTPSGGAGTYPGSGAGNANVAISTDSGITWSSVPTPYNAYYGGGAYGAGTFIAAGNWYGNVLNVSYSNSVGALTLAPTLPGTIDRVDIGTSTPGSGAFTSLSADSISTSGDISSAGNITVLTFLKGLPGGNLTISSPTIVTGNVTANYFVGNGSLLTTLPGYAYSNVNVAAYVTTANSAVIGYIDQANSIQSAQISAANVGIKGYVDQANSIQSAQITAANVGMKGYVDSQLFYSNTKVATYLQAGNISNVSVAGNVTATYFVGNGALLTGIIASSGGTNYSNTNVIAYLNATGYNLYSNANVTTYLPTYSGNVANIRLGTSGVLTFADGTTQTTASTGGGSSYGNANVTAYTVSMGFTNYSNVNVSALITTNGLTNYSNVNVKAYAETMGYQNYGNVNVAAYVTTSNSAIIGYIDLANTIQSAQVNAANLAITAANLGMKGYVDSVASQSIFGNGNVKSYLTQFDGNIVPSANVTYSLGNITNRWKDLYLSGNTIFLGDTTITTSGGAVLTPVTRQLFSQSFLPGSTNSAATFTLDRLPTAGSTRTVLVIGVQGGGPAPSYILTEGVDFTISGLSLIITASYTATNISCTESYSDTGDLITATEVATDTITPGSGDLTVSGNVTVDGDLYVSPTSIYMGNLRISAVDGNLKVNTAIKFSDDSVQSTAYSNVKVKAYTESMGFQNYGNVNVAALITTNGLTNYSNVNVIAYLAGNITVGNIAGSVNGFAIGYRDVPQITAANVTLIASDAGKHYYGANTNPTTITIPTNANVAFGNGTAISIVNQGTGNITVANAAGVLLYLAGNSTAGSRTLTSYGMATLIKVQVNTWFINGTGVV